MDMISKIRGFNRFFAGRIGLMGQVSHAGLSYTESRILYEIGTQPGQSARVLVRQFGLDEGYVSRVIKALDARGLIRRSPSPRDARVNLLDLTTAGAEAYQVLVTKAEDAVRHMIADLPGPSTDQVVEALMTVQAALSWPEGASPAIREIGTGDPGWVIKRHGELYAAQEGFDLSFEALVAQIVAEFVQTAQAPREKGWVAVSGDVRLGSVFVVAEDANVARLRLMLVEPFARGKGVGQMLVETAINHARGQGFERLVLWTQRDLKAACRLYARNGFDLVASETAELFGKKVENQTWELGLN